MMIPVSRIRMKMISTNENEPAHFGTVHGARDGYEVINCEACGFRHVMPMPTREALEALYTEDYYTQEKPNYLLHATGDAAWAELAYEDQLDLIADALPSCGRRLLDVGSGPGHFLSFAAARGWRVLGVEPSRQAAVFARSHGLEIHNSFFTDECADTIGDFDAVRMMNVLEHVPDPLTLLVRAARLMEKNRILMIGVPNDFNPLQRMLAGARRLDPWWIAPPHHLNYFDFDSLERLIRRAGFTPKGRLTSFPMEMFIAQGENYIGDGDLGRLCHAKRMAFDCDLEEASPGHRRAFYRALASAGFGREAVVIATKD